MKLGKAKYNKVVNHYYKLDTKLFDNVYEEVSTELFNKVDLIFYMMNDEMYIHEIRN